jgi:S1-C subfamily serine protease
MKRVFSLKLAALPLIFAIVLCKNACAQVSLAPLVRKIQPAVVTITTFNMAGERVGLGSGFFVSKRGLLITNYHVLEGGYSITVETADGNKYRSKITLEEDKRGDLVCLAVDIPESKVKYLKVTGTMPEPGDRIMAIGSPLGLEQTVSDGVVSAIRTIEGFGEILQISAPISRGSSGGPVVNLRGEVVGVSTFQIVAGQNLNFAIPGFRVLAMQKKAENSLSNQGKNVQEDKLKESIEPHNTGKALVNSLYQKYYNQGMVTLGRAKLAGVKKHKILNYQEAIRSFELALLAKPGDYLALEEIGNAKAAIRKLQQQR